MRLPSDIARTVALIPADTHPLIYLKQVEFLSRLSDEDRLRATSDFCESVWRLARQGVRRQHPDFSERQADEALSRSVLGESLFEQARKRKYER